MKINEILKKENVGKKYKIGDSTFEVVFRNDYLTLSSSDEWVVLSDFYLNADFEEVKKEGWCLNKMGLWENYYIVDAVGGVKVLRYAMDNYDTKLKDGCNMFLSREKAEEVANEQLLYRKMKKFRDENDVYVDWFKGNHIGHSVTCDLAENKFRCSSSSWTRHLHTIYFTTRELAQRCLEEVVKPHFGIKE